MKDNEAKPLLENAHTPLEPGKSYKPLAPGGVFGAALRLFPWYSESKIKTPFYDHDAISQSISAILFVGLCLYLWFNSVRRVKED